MLLSLKHKQQISYENMNNEVRLAQTPTSVVSWVSDVCDSCPAAHLRVSGYPPNPPPPTRVALRCELASQSERAEGRPITHTQRVPPSPLTGRHKYSSTSSPRVNGCPSGHRVPAADARAPLSQRQGRLQRCRNLESRMLHQVLEKEAKTLLSSGVLIPQSEETWDICRIVTGQQTRSGIFTREPLPLFIPNATWPIRINLF